jgi:hypothetical protein
VRKIVLFLQRQRVHVGAQRNAAALRVTPAFDDRDDAGLADARVMLDAVGVERIADEARSAMLVEAELRMRVEVAADAGEVVGPAANAGDGVEGLDAAR